MIEETNNNGVHHDAAAGQHENGGEKPSIDDLIENLFRKELVVKLEKLEHENTEQVKSLNGFTTSVQEMLTFAQRLADEEKAREQKEKEAKEAKEAKEKEHPPVHHKPEHKEPKDGHKEIKEHPSPATEKKGPRGMSKVQSEAVFKTKKPEAKDGDKKKGGLDTIDEVSQSVIISKGGSHASGKKSKEEGDPVTKNVPLVKPKVTKPATNKATPRPTVTDKAKGKDEESKEEEEKKESGKKTDEKKRPQTAKPAKPADKETKEPHKKPAEKKDEEEEKKEGKKEIKRPVTAKPPKKEGDAADKKDEKKEEKKPVEKKEVTPKPPKEPKEKPVKEEKKGKDEKKEDKKPAGKEGKDVKDNKKPAKEEKKNGKGKEEKPAGKATDKAEEKKEETKPEEKKEEAKPEEKKEETIPVESKPEEKKEEPKPEEKKEEAPAPTISSENKPKEETPAETQPEVKKEEAQPEAKKEEAQPEVLDINGHSPAKQAEEHKDKSPDSKSPSKMCDSLDSINQFSVDKKPEEKPVTSIPESPSAQEINNINDPAPAPVIAPVEVKRFQPLNEEQQNVIRELWRQIKVPGLKLNPEDPEDRVHEVGERLLQESKENLAECETRIQNLSKDINFDQPEEPFQFAMLTTAGLDVIEPMFVNELQGKSPIDPTVLRLLKIFMIIMGENVVDCALDEAFWKNLVIPFLEKLKDNIGNLKTDLQTKTNLPFPAKYEIERLVQQNPAVLKVTIYENMDAFCGFISFGILELCERYGVVNAQDFDDDKTGRQNNRAIVGYLRDKCEFYKQNIAKLAPLV